MAVSRLVAGLFWACVINLTTAEFTNQDQPFDNAFTPDVTFASSNRFDTRIRFLEERSSPIRIAKMNYVGATFQDITEFEDGKSNVPLGAVGELDTDGVTWYLVINLPQDFENPSQKSYGFYVDTGIGSPQHLVSITIENINDNNPIITAKESECKIQENNAVSSGSSICTFSVLDRDGGTASINYKISNLDFGVAVVDNIDDFTATVALTTPGLDFEKFSLYILEVTATDGGGLAGSTSYVVQVLDVADQAPTWTSPIIPQTIPEEKATTIKVTAIDGDIGISGTIGYELENHNSTFFSIDDNGLITVAAIDRDVLDNAIFTFLVTAFELDEVTSRISSTMTVIVEDVNDNVPTITANALTTSINEATILTLDLAIQVNDPDLGDFGQFDITLEDKSGNGWNEYFLLIPNSGYRTANVAISVQNAAALDFEDASKRTISLQLIASEQMDASRRHEQEIVITLLDLNDQVPVFVNDAINENIQENIKKGAVVATVFATDADDGDVVTHSFSSAQKALTINPLTGVITVAVDNAFDFERQTEIIIQVVAEDVARHKSFAQLSLTIEDVNDTPPILDMPTTQPTVTENSLLGTDIIATITASDEDTDAKLVFSIDWLLSTATKQGARVADVTAYQECIQIDTVYPDLLDTRNAEAVLSVLEKKLDWETFDTLSLRIVATDENTHPDYLLAKSRFATLAIEILDENDNAPQFTTDSQTAARTVFEHSGTGQLIGSVVAVDFDGTGNNKVTYSIVTDDPRLPQDLVEIDAEKGELRVNLDGEISCDTEYGDQMRYKVTATDGELSSDLTISIGIIDTNDKVPQHTVTEYVYYIDENSATGTAITTVGATDEDFTAPFHTVSYFIDGSEDSRLVDLFYLDENTGQLEVQLNDEINAVLDRDEGTTFYEIVITFRDNYRQGSNSPVSLYNSTKIIVYLNDENDNAPVFPIFADEFLAEPLESVKANTVIYAGLTATDKDAGENAVVSYSVVSYERLPGGSTLQVPDNLFDIETTADSKGNIKVTNDLKDLWGEYKIELRADDHGAAGSSRFSTQEYRIHIVDLNDNSPVIVYPVEGEVIRLREDQSVDSPLLDKNNVTIALFRATDADSGDNAVVSFEIVGNAEAKDYFKIVNEFNGEPNAAQLQLQKELTPEAKTFQLEINATDNGTPKLFDFVSITLVIVKVADVEPQFTQRTWDVTFMENSASETATLDPPAEDENNDHLIFGDPEWDFIYYYLIADDSPGLPFFSLDKETGILTLKEELDREQYMTHTLHVLASNLETLPNTAADPESLSQLVLKVKVGDEDDSAPVFDADLWPGGISTSDVNGNEIMTIKAVDPDEATAVTYLLLKETMVADPSLVNVKDTAFILEPTTGRLILNFDPDSRMSGFFEFQVEASDIVGGENHTAIATVKVFIITDSNRVVFNFLNVKEEVDAMKQQMREVFTETIGFNCTIDAIVRATDGSGNVLERETDVTTHFIDTEANAPVENNVITDIVTSREKITEMKRAFFNLEPYPLELADYDPGTTPPLYSSEELLRIILIVVSVVLGTLLILLFAAFFIKTRSLNRRLEALSTTKFGSQDSGLNRVGMSAPGANKRAIEGSNPVWNEDLGTGDYDNISQGSYDSDLIGVEENPEFNTVKSSEGHVNSSYDADVMAVPNGLSGYQDGGQSARPSINPLSNGGTLRGISHHVSIDNQQNDGNNYASNDGNNYASNDGDNYAANDNFTFE